METTLASLGLLRVAVVCPEMSVGDVRFNTEKICSALEECSQMGCQLIVFPELCITGYTCADLFYQNVLLEEAWDAVVRIAELTGTKGISTVVGVPVCVNSKLYNCGVFISYGEILGIIPKSFLPTTSEFYEHRWFSSDFERMVKEMKWIGGGIPFGKDLLFQANILSDCMVGVEICEDLWAPIPPSSNMAIEGANVILNLSGSNELLGKSEYRTDLVESQSGRCLAAYLYASSGPGESTTDVVFGGHCMIAENGSILSQTKRLEFSTQIAVADIDIQRLVNERIKNSTFSQSVVQKKSRVIEFMITDSVVDKLHRPISSMPFVPAHDEQLSVRCQEILAIQTTALAKRMKVTKCSHIVLGISGGLDSTLALLVAVKTFEKLGIDYKNIVAITMPGFGTTSRTKSNAEKLAESLGVTLRIIPIDKAVEQHFKDIGHNKDVHDVTYENAQARERTQILMDVANQVKGIALGTGDMSELALGWCTYNGDHMSMYNVNAGIPKTLVRCLIEWCSKGIFSQEVSVVLEDICNTPISPELLPADAKGQIKQVTEDKIGPYILHDFFLYHAIRLQFTPKKILFMAQAAFKDKFSTREILYWMRVFYKRFFANQFKRSCMPDGPKIGSVSLSPRGDWRMPSDASVALWLQSLDKIEAENAENAENGDSEEKTE